MRGRWIAASVGLGGMAAALTALAQAPSSEVPLATPVLHEDLRSPVAGSSRPRRAAAEAAALLGEDPAAGHNPTAIREDQKILPEPEGSTQHEGDEPIHGRGGFGADRSTESAPDDQTGRDDTLHYVEVFNPSVVPFKRMSALDAVREDYTLGIADTVQRDLRVTGTPTPGYDRFWGSMLIELKPGEDVPIPSVAPEMRIVSYEVEPRTQLTFSVDGADNYYVRGDEATASGVHRLVFLVEANPRYFAPAVTRNIKVGDIPAGKARPVPPAVARRAADALRRLDLRRDTPLNQALDRLVDYFRGFEAKAIRQPSGDLYWDLFTQKAGVCRHRAFAFMITANTLGIPTRFVSNEAHAWVEVWVPRARTGQDGSWLRVDLGGAALSLEVKNANGKSMYRPRGEDPFPKPREYSENYTRLEGDISGLSADQLAEARSPRMGSGGPGSAGPADGAAAAGDPAPRAAGDGDQGDDPTGDAGDAGDAAPPAASPREGMPAYSAAALRGKRATAIRVTGASSTAFRGESVLIEGAVTGPGDAGLNGLHVILYLSPVGRGTTGARVVGHAVTGPDGRFRAEVPVPLDIDLVDHEVFASTPGDDRQQPSNSR